jgi:signal transduction histidine kinase/CheY-like chemotaxis protein
MSHDNGAKGGVEAALRAGQERYRNLFENMSSGFAIFELEPSENGGDPAHLLVQANIEFERLLGIDRIRDSGRSVEELGFGWPPSLLRNHRAVAESGGFINYEWRDAARDLHFEIRVFCPREGSYAVLLNDITARKQAEGELAALRDDLERLVESRTRELVEARRQAESANRSKSLFLANMSHELRTPMNAIQGFSRILVEDPSVDLAAREKLRIIHRSGEHLLSIISQILDFSKLESGKMTLQPEEFDPIETAREVVELLRVRSDSKGIGLELRVDPGVPRRIRSDPAKLRQILTNLAGNAIKFTTGGGVSLRLLDPGPEGAHLVLEVEDSGPGIPPEETARIFEPFEQVGHGEGTGLGLPISLQYARMLGGGIEVESTPGRGSIFRARIGLERVDGDGDAGDSLASDDREGEARSEFRVLVVEDHPDNRLLLRNLLEPLGISVRECADGDAGVAAVRDWDPHLVLLDRRMPVLDGLEAVREIRAMSILHQPVVVAVTAHSFDDDRKEMLDAGCDDFLAKPFRESDLFAVLERHLGIRNRVRTRSGSKPTLPGPRDLEKLPDDLASEFLDALGRADMGAVDHALGRVGEIDPELREALGVHTDAFEYAALSRSLRGIEPGDGAA